MYDPLCKWFKRAKSTFVTRKIVVYVVVGDYTCLSAYTWCDIAIIGLPEVYIDHQQDWTGQSTDDRKEKSVPSPDYVTPGSYDQHADRVCDGSWDGCHFRPSKKRKYRISVSKQLTSVAVPCDSIYTKWLTAKHPQRRFGPAQKQNWLRFLTPCSIKRSPLSWSCEIVIRTEIESGLCYNSWFS